MKIIARLSAICLLLLSGVTQATVISHSCTDNFDASLGYVVGQTCNTVSSYQLAGTVTFYSPVFNITSTSSNITGTMTQESLYVEDYYSFSAWEDITTSLTLSMPFTDAEPLPFIADTYTMVHESLIVDWGTPDQTGITEMLVGNSGLSPDGLSLWSITEDGAFASLNTLDGNGDGINGINFYMEGGTTPFYIADIQLHTVPVPAAVWLFGCGLLTLFGFCRRRI